MESKKAHAKHHSLHTTESGSNSANGTEHWIMWTIDSNTLHCTAQNHGEEDLPHGEEDLPQGMQTASRARSKGPPGGEGRDLRPLKILVLLVYLASQCSPLQVSYWYW